MIFLLGVAMNKIDLGKHLNNGLNFERIIHKFLSQILDENRLKLVEIKEKSHLPMPDITVYAFMTCTQSEINKLISFPQEYVSYRKYYKTIDGFRTHKKFEIYNIEYHEYEEDDFFQKEIQFIVIKKSYNDFASSECAKRILVAEDNLNDAKHAIDNIGVMY